jgi:HNH endonuclease
MPRPSVKIVAKVVYNEHEADAPVAIFEPPHGSMKITLHHSKEDMERQWKEPILYNTLSKSKTLWIFRNRVVQVECDDPDEELLLRVKHVVLREEKALTRIKREVEAFENIDRLSSARRYRIPDSVRLFVWQRDEGKCVKCGSSQKLEYDHIIPLAEGGSDTERNIQLLCESCNRGKGKSI